MQQNQTYAFCALLSRMKYITRWGLMRSSRAETLSEHTVETAIIAHVLGFIARDIYGENGIRPDSLAVSALYHDASEIITGDMPTPVKYKNDTLKQAYKSVEAESAKSLISLLPAELQGSIAPFLEETALSPAEKLLLKAADTISALAKCMEEESSGNTEFASAQKQQIEKLHSMNLPAVNYFMQHFLPCYQQNLDELTHNL